MKTKNLTLWSLLLTLTALTWMTSCDDDETEPIPEPVADFSSSIDGKTVTFTDASTDAETYAWDFGDGNTSVDASPSHTYTANGSYIAKLTVSNASGDDSKQEVLEIINITIDGNFSDWDDVSAISTGEGTVTSLKVENLGNNKLFVYVEGSDDLTDLTQVMINTDNDQTTGALIDWLYPGSGEDVLIEGNIPAGDEQYASIYPCSPCDGSMPGNWNWGTPINEDVTAFIEASSISNVSGGKAYEFSIDLTALGTTVNSEAIGIGVLDVSLDTWGPVGAIPALFNENDNPDAALHTYTFK